MCCEKRIREAPDALDFAWIAELNGPQLLPHRTTELDLAAPVGGRPAPPHLRKHITHSWSLCRTTGFHVRKMHKSRTGLFD